MSFFPPQGLPVGVRTATLVVAAHNSSPQSRAQADFVCDGVDDQVEIQAAIHALPTGGGRILLLEGLYVKGNAPGISLPSNTEVELVTGATIRLADRINADAQIFVNRDAVGGNSNIHIHGGILDGNRAGQTAGEQGIIRFTRVSNSKVDCLMQNARSYYIREITPGIGSEFINRAYPLSKKIEAFETLQEITPPSRLISNMETGWTLVQNAFFDTTTFFSTSQSLRLSPVGNLWDQRAEASFAISMDASRAHLHLLVRCSDARNLQNFVIFFHTPTAAIQPMIVYDPFSSAINGTWFQIDFTDYELPFPPGTDLSNVQLIRLIAQSRAGITTDVWIDKIWISYPNALGLVTFVWDDGAASIPVTCAPIFERYGYKAVIAATGSGLGTIGTMTTHQFTRLQDMGWDITNHSWDHLRLLGASEAVAEDDVRRMQDWLIRYGFTRGARFWVAPFAEIDNIGYAVASQYHLASFLAGADGDVNNFPDFNHKITKRVPLSVTTQAKRRELIERTISEGRWLILYGHQVGPIAPGVEITEAELDELLAFCQARGAKVVTFSDIWDKYRQIPLSLSAVSDLFMDVLAASLVHIHPLVAYDALARTTVTSPDVPRNVSASLRNNTATPINTVACTCTITGLDTRGTSITEIITIPAVTGLAAGASTTVFGHRAFATVSQIQFSVAAQPAGTQMCVGISDRLGLSKIIYARGDVYKVKRNTANVAVGTVDVVNGTVDCAPITAMDDFTVYYRSNLNIVS